MRTLDRRTFLGRTALFAAASGRLLADSARGEGGGPDAGGPGEPRAPPAGPEPAAAQGGRGTEHPFFKQRRRPVEVIAHRGGAGQWPEETLYALEQATRVGVDVLEIDVHSTSDGVPVLMHDSSVARTTNGTEDVRSYTCRRLRELDAGYWWTPDRDRHTPKDRKPYPFRGKCIKVPMLEEVFGAFPHMRMNIEIKGSDPSLVDRVCEMIRCHGMEEKVLVASLHGRVVEEFRTKCPEVATSVTKREWLRFLANSPALTSGRSRPDAIQVKDKLIIRLINSRRVAAARALGLPLHAWTVNDLEEMNHLVGLGVDGIITDYPGALLALLDRTPPGCKSDYKPCVTDGRPCPPPG